MVLTLAVGGAASGQDSLSSSTVQYHPLGTIAYDRAGGKYRYFLNGAADTVAGDLYQSPAPVANHLAMTPPAVAIGAKSFTCTPGATLGTANQYGEGFLQVDTAPGNGYMYAVSGHPAFASATAFTLTLQEAIVIALTTSSRIGLIANPWNGVIIAPTTLTAQVAGFAMCVVTAAQYGWLKTRGPVAALINGTPAVTAPVINGATTAGSVDVWTAAAQPTAQLVGKTMQVGVSTKNNAVFATID